MDTETTTTTTEGATTTVTVEGTPPTTTPGKKGERRPEHQRALDHVNALLRMAHAGGDITTAEEDSLLSMRRRFRTASERML